MEGERLTGFSKLLDQNTAKLKSDDIPHAESWPFIVTLLTHCISLEISASKKRPPKLYFAKTLRSVIQYAENARLSAVQWSSVNPFSLNFGAVLAKLIFWGLSQFELANGNRQILVLVCWFYAHSAVEMDGLAEGTEETVQEEKGK
ncbi:hypothetical protein ACLOJK_001954 [Asimina triloba]